MSTNINQFDVLQAGDRLKQYFNPGNINNKMLHVRGRVDGLLIVRSWSKHRQRWEYEVKEREWFIVFAPHLTLHSERRS